MTTSHKARLSTLESRQPAVSDIAVHRFTDAELAALLDCKQKADPVAGAAAMVGVPVEDLAARLFPR